MVLKEQLKNIWSGEVEFNCSLADYSTLKAGGPAEALVKPGNIEELASLLAKLSEAGIDWRVIGKGSNVLALDQGVAGVVIVMGPGISSVNFVDLPETIGQSGTDHEKELKVKVEAGCSLAALINWCIEKELKGLEFLAGIPGSVGGSVIMNAGAMGHEIGEFLVEIEMLSERGELITRKVGPEDFRYRSWLGFDGNVVVSATLKLKKGRKEEIKKRCTENINIRKQNQPKGASAGSFFKNPPGNYAGKLIDEAKLKGTRVGGAEISPFHGNFIINTGGATATDILTLMNIAQEKVKMNTGIWLEPEVKILGGK